MFQDLVASSHLPAHVLHWGSIIADAVVTNVHAIKRTRRQETVMVFA
jgi:hypothetical protein